VVELPVPRIYLDEKRSFGGALDDAERRIRYYHQVICDSLKVWPPRKPPAAELATSVCGDRAP
jgi:dolichol-phosphate mannosyltransferase